MKIYNVGSGIPKSMRLILKDLLKKADVPESAVVESCPAIINSKGFDVSIIYADISKVSKLMGLP